MRKIFESKLYATADAYSAERVYVYELEGDDFWDLNETTHAEKCEYFNVEEEYGVAPGSKYHRYEFHISAEHAVMIETIAWNV